MNTWEGPCEVQALETPATITTTLYDLIAAMQSVVEPEEDELVVAAVVHLLRSGRLTFVSAAHHNCVHHSKNNLEQ